MVSSVDLPPLEADRAKSEPARQAPEPLEEHTRSLSDGERTLQDVALPLLRRIAHRLELARHRVVIDDRTDRTPASIRFQVRPWVGPFDAQRSQPHPVLELLVSSDSDGFLARWWPSQSDDEPAEVRVIPLAMAERRLNRTLMDFVASALTV
jgi:hypothetical protein